jgi:two-component system NtrC family sensor kinase
MSELRTTKCVLAAIEHIGAGLLILDSQLNIRYCNPFILQRLPVKHERLLGRPLSDVFPEVANTNWHAMLEQVRETGEPIQTIWRDSPYLLHLNSSAHADEHGPSLPMRQATLLYSFMDDLETPQFGLAIFDNSNAAQTNDMLQDALKRLKHKHAVMNALHQQLKQANNQLLQTEKMAAIGQLAAGVAHEINNPIGFVASNLKTLADYVKQLLSLVDDMGEWGGLELEELKKKYAYRFICDDISGLLHDSNDGLERVEKIISSLRNFAQVGDEAFAQTNLLEGIESALNAVNNEIKDKAEIITDFTAVPPLECIGPQINQVIMNLLVNAAQSIEGFGSISLRTRSSEDEVCIEIEDTGSGMPAEISKRIFEPFFTTKPVGKGTGLGLSLAFNIIEKHHGRITVSSTLGKGSCFKIYLPLRQPLVPAIATGSRA